MYLRNTSLTTSKAKASHHTLSRKPSKTTNSTAILALSFLPAAETSVSVPPMLLRAFLYIPLGMILLVYKGATPRVRAWVVR